MLEEHTQRVVVQQWMGAATALAGMREQELRHLTESEALQAAEELLSLVRDFPREQNSSGLVEQQRLFSHGRS